MGSKGSRDRAASEHAKGPNKVECIYFDEEGNLRVNSAEPREKEAELRKVLDVDDHEEATPDDEEQKTWCVRWPPVVPASLRPPCLWACRVALSGSHLWQSWRNNHAHMRSSAAARYIIDVVWMECWLAFVHHGKNCPAPGPSAFTRCHGPSRLPFPFCSLRRVVRTFMRERRCAPRRRIQSSRLDGCLGGGGGRPWL